MNSQLRGAVFGGIAGGMTVGGVRTATGGGLAWVPSTAAVGRALVR